VILPVSYFAFGSNMSRARLVGRIGAVKVLGAARLPDHRHRFSKRGSDGTGKGNIEPHPGGVVHGVLYGLHAAQLDRLAEFEGGYRRRDVMVVASQGAVLAATFVALPPGTAPPPSEAYLDHYRRGIAEHGLPAAYLDELLESIR